MIERATTFGRSGNLAGVLTEPEPERARPGAPAVLMWNIGIHHHVGPYRVQVDIARELARRGYVSLRFDVAGMGDSDVSKDTRVDEERALDDIHDAMTLLERRRLAGTFLPIGFCSSVDAAHALSLADSRVVAACFIEGYASRTRGFWLHYPLRLFEWQRWKRRISQKKRMPLWGLGRWKVDDPEAEERAALGPVLARTYPTPAQFGTDVHAMAARGVRLLFVYVGGDTDFNHDGQFEEMIGGRPPNDAVSVTYYHDADHTFYRVDDRRRVVVRVADWIAHTFPAESTGDAYVSVDKAV